MSTIKTLRDIEGCFEAAYIEGLADALAETTDKRLKDLVVCRLLFAHGYATSAIAENIANKDAPALEAVPVHQFRQKVGQNDWIECDSRCEDRMKQGPAFACFEFRTLYTAPPKQEAAPLAEACQQNMELVIARLEQIAGNFSTDYREDAEQALVCARAILASKEAL